MGSLSNEVGQNFLAMVASGNIRYHAQPLAPVAVANDANWDELYVAAASPAVPHWLCGFEFSIATTIVQAELVMFIDLGYGGADGGAVAAGTVLLTNWPICFCAVGAGLGPYMHQNQMLPYPIRIPVDIVDPGSRMAVRIASSDPAGVALVAFRVILATAVGT